MAGQDSSFDASGMVRKVSIWETSPSRKICIRTGPLSSCGQQVEWPSGKLAASSGNG